MKYTKKMFGGYVTYDEDEIASYCGGSIKNAIKSFFIQVLCIIAFVLLLGLAEWLIN